MTDEWEPWRDHDGMGCPYQAGDLLQIVYASGKPGHEDRETGYLHDWMRQSPVWQVGPEGHPIFKRILRHRRRKPDATRPDVTEEARA